MKKKDILIREDIELLVNTFYDKIKKDDTIGYFFTEIANVDWPTHLPKMYDFWESILLSSGEFKGNPMAKHMQLNLKSKLKPAHFEHWLQLWQLTVDELFIGEKAEETKTRAKHIAGVIAYKISQQ
jgi:hemoglobin